MVIVRITIKILHILQMCALLTRGHSVDLSKTHEWLVLVTSTGAMEKHAE